MCGSATTTEQWLFELPQEPGDYLWAALWGCGCIRKSGCCWIDDFDGDEPDAGWGELKYQTRDGKWLAIHWHESRSEPPTQMSKGYDVHAFLKISPPHDGDADGGHLLPIDFSACVDNRLEAVSDKG